MVKFMKYWKLDDKICGKKLMVKALKLWKLDDKIHKNKIWGFVNIASVGIMGLEVEGNSLKAAY